MRNAIVVGDVMLDRLVIGRVERISPEAPVPVFEEEGRTVVFGGAGNVFQNLRRQGVSSLLVGATGVGGVSDRMHELSLGGLNLLKELGRHTTEKTRFVTKNGQHLFRVDKESRHPISDETALQIAEFVRGMVAAGPGVLVLSDYDKGVLGSALVCTLIGDAKDHGWPVVSGPKKRISAFRGSTVACVNWREFVAELGVEPKNPEAIGTYGWELANKYGLENLVVTAGASGAYLIPLKGMTEHFKAEPCGRVVDVTGAGDTVLATIAGALCRDEPLPEAVALAMQTAGRAVCGFGTVAVPLPEDY